MSLLGLAEKEVAKGKTYWYVVYEYLWITGNKDGGRQFQDWQVATEVFDEHPVDWLATAKENYRKASDEHERGERWGGAQGWCDYRLLFFHQISESQYNKLSEDYDEED